MSDDLRLGSTVPARLRITAWILLATATGLAAVVLTMRSAEITDAERSANRDLAQEIDEFKAFAAEVVDPETGMPYASARGLLERHLEREYPSVDEVLVGYVDDGVEPALVVGSAPDPVGLSRDPGTVEDLVTGDRVSGIAEAPDGARYRWALARVQPTTDGPAAALVVAVTMETERAAVDAQVRLAVLVSLGGLVVTAAVALVAAGRILEPVRVISRTAGRISRSQLDERIPVAGRDDLADLARTVNAMLDRLQHTIESHRWAAAAASAHIRPSLTVLAQDADAERRAHVERIGGMLDDLALLADSEATDFLRPEPTDLRDLGGSLMREVRAATGREWTLDAPADGTAVVDPRRVREAVLRLAENAAAADPAGPLALGIDPTADAVAIWVADAGPGLDPERARHAFDRHDTARTDDTPPEDTAGPGLGLAVVRAVADAHGGTAWVETAPGRGARFGMDLPVRPPREAS